MQNSGCANACIEQNFLNIKNELDKLYQDAKAKREESNKLGEQLRKMNEIFRQSHRDIRKISDNLRSMSKEYYDQIAQYIIDSMDINDYPKGRVIAIVKNHVTNASISSESYDKSPCIYDFIVYAILRGKSWNDSLSATTRYFKDRHIHTHQIYTACQNRLAKIIANDLLYRHRHLLVGQHHGRNNIHFYRLNYEEEMISRIIAQQYLEISKDSSFISLSDFETPEVQLLG